MKKISITVIVTVFIVNMGFAAFNKDDAGTSSAQFLKLGVGGRATSMGNAYVGVADDSTAIYWNPAGINRIENVSVSVAHNIMFENIFYDWVSGAKKFGFGTLGVGIQYLSYGSIDETDDTGLGIGSFKPNDMALSISYGREIKDVSLGLNVKYISEKIKKTASAFAFDIGGMYKMMYEKLTLGIAAQNIGTKMKFEDEKESLPLNIKVGGAYRIKKDWLVAFDINAPYDDETNLGAGLEHALRITKDINVFGRAGYNTSLKNTGGLNGLTAGLGGSYMGYCLDYAFVPFGDLGNSHRVSLGIKF